MDEKQENKVTLFNKSYIVGEVKQIPNGRLFAQATSFEDSYSIRVVISVIGEHHNNYKYFGMFWELPGNHNIKKEECMFDSIEQAEQRLEELCSQYKWDWYY